MCGICGVIGFEQREEGARVLGRMLQTIIRRGPDEEGRLLAPGFAAGTRRLSIIDLAGGSQPIWNETQTLAICYNGEIYNFEATRAELAATGHQFRTRSDTEVILHAYEQWGPAGFSRLHGMFAFVLAEMPDGPAGRVRRAILARDRFGIKPLYYATQHGKLLFASELRALLASGIVPGRISPEAVRSFLLFGSVGEPNTMVESAYMLPPGHYAELTIDAPPSGILVSKPFWSIKDSKGVAWAAKGASPARVTRNLQESAVRSHLIADVPIGVFLSSGLDSTAIATLAARAHPGIHSFNVAFPDLEFSEAAEARRTAERLGTTHTELQLSGGEMLSRLDEAIGAFDQPSMDGVNTYFVSWAARQAGLKVALSGLGSDEIFGGYPTFRATHSIARLMLLASMTPGPLRALAVSAVSALKRNNSSSAAFDKAAAAWLAPDDFPHPYFFTRSLFTANQVAGTLAGTTERSADQGLWLNWLATSAAEVVGWDAFTTISWLELRSYMLNTLLRDTDSMSMASSLEVRVPFLDPALVEYVLSLPKSEKRNAGQSKWLLVNALGDLLPRELAGQRKRTFTFPWENWLKGPLRERIETGFRDWSAELGEILPQSFALNVWSDYRHGRTTWSRPWSIYILNEWAKRHLDRARGIAPLLSGVGLSASTG